MTGPNTTEGTCLENEGKRRNRDLNKLSNTLLFYQKYFVIFDMHTEACIDDFLSFVNNETNIDFLLKGQLSSAFILNLLDKAHPDLKVMITSSIFGQKSNTNFNICDLANPKGIQCVHVQLGIKLSN